MLENYEDSYEGVVKFANQHCNVEFEPETRFFDDIPDPILSILNKQKFASYAPGTKATISKFVEAVVKKNSSMLPLSVQGLPLNLSQQLTSLCNSLCEITTLFRSVNRVSHTYRDKEGYVVKRIYQLSQDEKLYSEEGFGGGSRAYYPTYGGRPWHLGDFPTDPEIVACVFTSLLEYSLKEKR